MTQETFLFHDTVAENLKVAKEDATEEELERAAAERYGYSFLRLKH